MAKLEDLKKEVDKALKEKKDAEMNNNLLDGQIGSKKNALAQLSSEIESARKIKQSLENDFLQKNKELIADLEARKKAVVDSESLIKSVRENLARESNILLEEKGRVLQKSKEIDLLRAVYNAKLEKILNLAEELKK